MNLSPPVAEPTPDTIATPRSSGAPPRAHAPAITAPSTARPGGATPPATNRHPAVAHASSPRAPAPRMAFPWATVAIAVAALLAAVVDRTGAAAILYVREDVLAGEVWRLWTAHLAHFGLSHLGWNLLVLLPIGAWAERLAPARTRIFYAIAPALIGIALLIGPPALTRYGGLSGIAAGLVVLLALAQFSGARGCDRWLGWTLLGAVAVKIVAELITGHAAFANLPSGEVRPVPLAHLAGVFSAVALHFATLRLKMGIARVRRHG